MGKHARERSPSPQETVRRLMAAGKVKKKCCRSKPLCKRCPVRALKKAKDARGA